VDVSCAAEAQSKREIYFSCFKQYNDISSRVRLLRSQRLFNSHMLTASRHPYATGHNEVRDIFDLFISSAHVGMRKPDPVIYNYAVRALNEYSTAHGGSGVTPSDILFLDDIGENLKTAKKIGFNTIKVNLGRAFEAVGQLEEVTGLKLAGNHPKVPVVSHAMKKAAKL